MTSTRRALATTRSVRTAVCAAALVVAAFGGPTARAQDEKAAVLAVVTRLFDGMRAKDEATIRAVFHPTAQLVTAATREGKPDIQVMTLDAFVAAVTRPRPEIADERTRNEIVQIDGGLASVWTDYGFFIGPKFNHCGVDAVHLAKGAEGWKIVALADTRRTTGCEAWTK